MSRPATAVGVDAASVERVYRGRYADFLRVCIAMTGDVETAHDAVQDGFSRGLRSLPAGLTPGALEPWLWRVVTNVARDHARRATVRVARSVIPDSGAPSAVAESVSSDGGLSAALARLTDRQRTIVFLRYYADLSYDQIGAALEIRPGTVAATLNSAHTALRAILVKESS